MHFTNSGYFSTRYHCIKHENVETRLNGYSYVIIRVMKDVEKVEILPINN